MVRPLPGPDVAALEAQVPGAGSPRALGCGGNADSGEAQPVLPEGVLAPGIVACRAVCTGEGL